LGWRRISFFAQSFNNVGKFEGALLLRHTIEEAYEVADAVARGDLTDLREELGDLLLQVIFHSRALPATLPVFLKSWRRCARRGPAVLGISSRTSLPSPLIRHRKADEGSGSPPLKTAGLDYDSTRRLSLLLCRSSSDVDQ
jgi:NTP pyrophosphatase (non-canonical NTP hydrolase)